MSRIVGLTLTNINSLEFYNFDFDVHQYSKYCDVRGLLKLQSFHTKESIKTLQ